MDPILKFAAEKRKFKDLAKEPQSFFRLVGLAEKVKIDLSAALSANADMLEEASDDRLLIQFLRFAARNAHRSKSQLFQDLFAAFFVADTNPSFLEFGATDGVSLSNSFYLESARGWQGVLAEPSPSWHAALVRNRPNSTIVLDCVWTATGKQLDFFVSDVGVLSSLSEYRESDSKSMPGNSKARNSNGYHVKVNTVSLNDILRTYFFDGGPSYMSVDTEGSELDILKACDFSQFKPSVLSVEHNYTSADRQLDEVLGVSGYRRIFRSFTDFDAWYVHESVLSSMVNNST